MPNTLPYQHTMVEPDDRWNNDGGYTLPREYQQDDNTISYPGGSDDFDETGGGNYFEDPDVSGGTYQPRMPTFIGGPDTVSNPTTGGPEGGGFGDDMWEYIKQVTGISGGANGGMSPQEMALFAASMGMAGKQWKDSDKWMKKSEEWGKEANPFGDQRDTYKGKLADLYANPNSIADSAAYKFRMQQGLNTLGPQLAAAGGGYGNDLQSILGFSQGLASTEYDKEHQRLAGLAGANIGPEASIRAKMSGMENSIKSQNAALGAAMFPFGKNYGDNRNGGGGGGAGGGGAGGNVARTVMQEIQKAGGLEAVMAAARAGAPEAIKLLTSMTKAWDAPGSDLTERTPGGSYGGDLAQADQDSINAGLEQAGRDDYFTPDDSYLEPDYQYIPEDLGDLTSFDIAYGF